MKSPTKAAADSEAVHRFAFFSPDEDPAWHAALEETLLRHSRHEFLVLWVNPPSLHVGKNQNIWSQVSAREVHRRAIPVYRRLSGGGTVYHDRGNLNFSIIATGEPRIDFCKHLGTILPFFHNRGIPAEIRNRSDLFCRKAKFSGNAEYFSGGRVLHHGTLLFDADLDAMHRTLSPDTGPYRDRSIDSNRSPTRNLSSLLPEIEDIHAFAEAILTDLQAREPVRERIRQLPGDILEAALELQPRYRDPDWVFGRSPPYSLDHSIGENRCHLDVSKGKILKAVVDFPGYPSVGRDAAALLPGCFHTPEHVLEALESLDISPPKGLTTTEFWIDLLF